MPGPIPKRSTERRRRNAASRAETVAPPAAPVEAPELPSGTHQIARDWYDSLRVSGQSQFYEPSDWAAALMLAAAMTRLFSERRFSALLFAQVWGAMGDMLTTESARRKARLEVERGKPPAEQSAPGAIALDDTVRASRKAVAVVLASRSVPSAKLTSRGSGRMPCIARGGARPEALTGGSWRAVAVERGTERATWLRQSAAVSTRGATTTPIAMRSGLASGVARRSGPESASSSSPRATGTA